MKLAPKLWLCLSVLLAGYAVSVAVDYQLNRHVVDHTAYVWDSAYPVSIRMEGVVTAHQNLWTLYRDAVLMGDADRIQQAEDLASRTVVTLAALAARNDIPPSFADNADKASEAMKALSLDAEAVYRVLIQAGDDPSPELQKKVGALARRRNELTLALTALSAAAAGDLEKQLRTVQSSVQLQSRVNITLFLLVLLITVPIVSVAIRRIILAPFRRILQTAHTGESLDPATLPSDEIGEMARAFSMLQEQQRQAQAELRGYQLTLEQRVQQRTAELSAEMDERRQAEAALRESDERFRQVAENAGEWIWEVDAQGLYRYCSPVAEKIVGYTPAELVGHKHFYDLFAPEVKESMTAGALGAFEEKAPFRDFTNSVVHKDGRIVMVETHGAPMLDEHGALLGYRGTDTDITERKRAQADLEKAQQELVDASRQAGMAEVATNVLHNVGNVLTSVNVSASIVSDSIRRSKAANLTKAAALLQEHADTLADFLTADPRGRQLPGYLTSLAEYLDEEREDLLSELGSLTSNIDHIKDIVAMQQSYGNVSGVKESVEPGTLVDASLELNAGALIRHDVQVVREYADTSPLLVEKHRVVQILVNLIRNAKYALDEGNPAEKTVTLRVRDNGGRSVLIEVIDNGIGIAPDIIPRIFEHGFTTRATGHGFGLHGAALTARELGGELRFHSDGPGQGTTFTLELPYEGVDGSREP